MAVRNVEYIIGLRDKFSSKMGNIQARTQALDGTMLRLRSTIGTLFTAFAAQRIISDIIKVGSNFEQLQISFETMLGNAEKATQLIKDLTKFAIETPFQLKDVSQGAKALLAFGIANEKILPTLKSLGDVAAGLSVPIERLILNFGQVKAQTILTGRELRDFAIAGVPLLGELAKIMGKTTAEVKTLISTGDVGFDVVEQAFKDMSSEGGKFFDLMKKQTASTGGQISNLRDVVALLENDFFKKFQPSLNAGVVALQDLIASLRTNIDTIVEIITAIGKFVKFLVIYKAIQISVNLIVRGAALANKIYSISLVLINRGLISSIRLMKGFRLALARTGIGLVVVGVAALVIALSNLKKFINQAESSQLRLNTAFDKAKEKTEKQIDKLKILIDLLNSETKARFVQQNALKELQRLFPKHFKNLDIEQAKMKDIIILQKKIAAGNKLQAILFERVAAKERLVILEEKATLSPKEFRESFQKGLRQQKGLIAKLTLDARKTKDTIARLEIQAKIDRIKQDLQAITPGITVPRPQVGITKIVSAAPKIFNINIDSLIENFTIKTTNLREGTVAIKEQVAEALLTALSDVQIQVR